jgi:dGTPase
MERPSHAEGGRDRRIPEPARDGEDEFRVDIERIRFSPYFSRLSAVTQVIPQAGSGSTNPPAAQTGTNNGMAVKRKLKV